MLYVLLKLLLPYPLAVTVPVSPPYHPPHLVTSLQPGTYRAEQWGHADMTLAFNADQNTYHAHFNTDDGPHDYTLSTYVLSCLPAGTWLTVKQPLVAGTKQPDPARPVSYTVSSGNVPYGNLYFFPLSRAEDDNGIMVPAVTTSAAEIESFVADFCDKLGGEIKFPHGQSPTVYSYAKP